MVSFPRFFRSSACVKFLKLCDKIRQFRVEDSATSSVASNKNVQLSNGAVESKKKSRETLFTNFLYQYIDEINQNLVCLRFGLTDLFFITFVFVLFCLEKLQLNCTTWPGSIDWSIKCQVKWVSYARHRFKMFWLRLMVKLSIFYILYIINV